MLDRHALELLLMLELLFELLLLKLLLDWFSNTLLLLEHRPVFTLGRCHGGVP